MWIFYDSVYISVLPKDVILFLSSCKISLDFQMFQVVPVLIHSYIILILILVPYANKEIQRPDLSCISCNPQYPLKSLLFLHG